MKERALHLLRQMLGPDAVFRPGQWEAIEKLVGDRQRVLVVQRTGWGKSIVYFLATKLLREQSAGFTLLISPLLALMRNQIEMADRIGVRAATINSSNRAEWDAVERALASGSCDLLLISPERLNNPRFRSLLSKITGRVGLFVVDEAHCISDWGHDFRPDYRRIVRILRNLPRGVPVLGTTATANDRVIADVQLQLGPGLTVLRGALARPSLRLQSIQLADQSERLAWLAENVPKIPGTGIVYCLTVADTERVAKWLRLKGFRVEAYHAGSDASIDRERLEQALLNNEIKALVATVALGMGFDKPDLGFVIHFQRPGSAVAYYQQVGRAGRALDRAYGILLNGREDDDIQDYFIQSAFPPARTMLGILDALEKSDRMSFSEILSRVNVSYTMAEKALRLLEIDGAVAVDMDLRPRRYFRTLNPWKPDVERIERVTRLRQEELAQMQTYVTHSGCLMEFLARALDDPTAEPCGRCANCRGKGLPARVSPQLVTEAVEFLKRENIVVAPRKLWPKGLFPDRKSTLPEEERNAPGRALCYYGDAGWGQLVREGKYVHGFFCDDLVRAAADLISNRWEPDPPPEWVAAIPSRRHPHLVPDFAERLANALGLPFIPVLVRAKEAPEQKTMANSTMQARNVQGTLAVSARVLSGPVLLVDDIVDSRWTLTMAGWLLRTHGSGIVYPFVLARATARKA
jgi:ATP-dependent DNA helicase RecQ